MNAPVKCRVIIACSTLVRSTRPLEEALRFIAQAGFRHVDVAALPGWAHVEPSEIAENASAGSRNLNTLLQSSSLKPVAVNGGTEHQLTSLLPDQQEKNLKQARALLHMSADIRAPVLVLQPGTRETDQKEWLQRAFEASAEVLSEIVQQAKRFRVTVAIEAHSGSLAERYEDAIRFVTRVPGLKLAFDPSHFIMNGMDLDGARVLLPHTAHVHLRNAVRGDFQAGMNVGSLDFMHLFEMFDTAGYDRAISVEYLDNRGTDVTNDVLALKTLLETRYKRV